MSQVNILRVSCGEADKLIMGIKYCNHHTISAINHRPNTHTCPLSNILKSNGITIVASPIQENDKLNRDRELRIVRSVLKNRVTGDIIKNIIKNLWVNLKFLLK